MIYFAILKYIKPSTHSGKWQYKSDSMELMLKTTKYAFFGAREQRTPKEIKKLFFKVILLNSNSTG